MKATCAKIYEKYNESSLSTDSNEINLEMFWCLNMFKIR